MLAQPEKYLYPFLPVIIPMGLMSALGSLQNIESAEAAGDRYSPTTSLAVDGLGTLCAAVLGSCFPTTMYIGHPGWKGLGARAGYSVYNGLFFVVLTFPQTHLVLSGPNCSASSFSIVLKTLMNTSGLVSTSGVEGSSYHFESGASRRMFGWASL